MIEEAAVRRDGHLQYDESITDLFHSTFAGEPTATNPPYNDKDDHLSRPTNRVLSTDSSARPRSIHELLDVRVLPL